LPNLIIHAVIVQFSGVTRGRGISACVEAGGTINNFCINFY